VTDVDPVWKPKPRRTTPKARRTAKLRADYNAWVAERLARRPPCVMCGHPAELIHHRRLRSQGGAVISHANTVPLCSWDHEWVHRNIDEARTMHLIVQTGDPDFALLGES
jgi:hypothetical protein